MDADKMFMLLIFLLSVILCGALILMIHFKKQVSYFKKECNDLHKQLHYFSAEYFNANTTPKKEKVLNNIKTDLIKNKK